MSACCLPCPESEDLLLRSSGEAHSPSQLLTDSGGIHSWGTGTCPLAPAHSSKSTVSKRELKSTGCSRRWKSSTTLTAAFQLRKLELIMAGNVQEIMVLFRTLRYKRKKKAAATFITDSRPPSLLLPMLQRLSVFQISFREPEDEYSFLKAN